MKRTLLKGIILSICLASTGVEMQAQTIQGRLVDEQQSPVEYANVVLLALPDSSFVNGAVTDMQGAFALPGSTSLKQGLVRVSSIGYKTLYFPYNGTASANQDLGTVALTSDAQLLGEVVVKSTLPKTRVKGSALVTNVEGTLLEKAGTLEGLLDKIPNVTAESGSVSVFGRGSAEVYINGRKMRDASELDQIAADNVKQVEVITHPGARYDASVKAVVRITTKRAQGDGFGFSNRLLADYDGTYLSPMEQFNANYRRGGLDLSGMVSYMIDKQLYGNDNVQTTYLDKTWTDSYRQDGQDNEHELRTSLSANYLFNPDHALGVRYDFRRTPKELERAVLAADLDMDGETVENSVTRVEEFNQGSRHAVNGYYNGKAAGWEINLNLDGVWLTEKDKQPESIDVTDYQAGQSYSTQLDVFSRTTSSLYAGKLDFGHSLWQGELTLGGEYDYTRRTDLYQNNVLFDSNTQVRENSQSVFAEYSRAFGKIQAQIGLRYERVGYSYYEDDVKKEEQSRTFRDFFPTLALSTQVGESQLQLSYRRDISRPSYSMLTSSITYGNRYIMQTGNPYLTPIFTDNVSGVWAWKWIQLYLAYQHTRDDIFYTTDLYTGGATDENAIAENCILIGRENVDAYDRFNASLNLAPTFGCWSPSLTTSMSKQWLWIDTPEGHKAMTQPIFHIQYINSFDLGHSLTLGTNVLVITKGHNQNMYISRNLWRGSLSLQKSWMKNRLTVRGEVWDLFKTWHQSNAGILYSGALDTTSTLNDSYRTGRITVTYKFNTARSKYRGTGAGESQKERM